MWHSTINQFASDGFHVIAVDMPPFGFSDRPSTPSYGRRDQAQRISDLLDALGVESAYLVRHSFGAGPTDEAVLRFPTKVRGLVPVGDPLVAASATNPVVTRCLLSSMIHRKERADRHEASRATGGRDSISRDSGTCA